MLDYYWIADVYERFSAQLDMNVPTDYGTGEKYNHVEIHWMSYIVDHPGISATEIARDWNRTKGAVSQIVSKLEKKGLVEKRKKKGDDKTVCLYPTEKGKKLDRCHREFDRELYKESVTELEKKFSREDIIKAVHVLEESIRISQNNHKKMKKNEGVSD